MGQQRLGKVAEDDLSKRPAKTTRRKTGNSVLDATTTRRDEAELAERPATRPGRPPSARELLSFLRFKLYFANPGDKLFGCKVAAVEGDPDGRSVSSRAILNAAESFGMRLSDKNLQIALAAAASFSGPVLRRKGHNIITTTGPAKAGA